LKNTRISIAGVALLWMVFHAWLLNSYFGIDWFWASADSGVFNLTLINAFVGSRYALRYLPQNSIVQAVVVVAAILAFLVQWISTEVMVQWAVNDTAYLQLLQQSVPVRWAFAFVAVALTGVITIFYQRWKDATAHQDRDTDVIVMAREAELQKLQLQLQPHFLFNSLNSINALVLINSSRARDMVQQLSDFLRATLKRADEQWITLKEELAYLELYLSIEKVRFGHRLDIQIESDDQIHIWLVPPLLIQPLVENAIKFGLYGTTEQVTIHIKTERIHDALQISISNPFDADMQPQEGSGFGLSGLQRRLYLLYARNDLLKTTIENNHFTVQLTLPEKI
jgi:two-component system, LytTR family, sensor kinase